MPIDLATEKRMTPKEYAEFCGPSRAGRPMSRTTFYRHAFKGIRGVRLEHIKIGGYTYTSVEAVQRFAAALSKQRASIAD